MWHTGEGMGWWMVFAGTLWLLFWSAAIYLVVQMSRRAGGEHASGRGDAPIDIARRRYAAGEISKDEFHQLRTNLSGRAS